MQLHDQKQHSNKAVCMDVCHGHQDVDFEGKHTRVYTLHKCIKLALKAYLITMKEYRY